MKTRLWLLILLTPLLVTIACGTSVPNLEATQVAQDKATMQALATAIAGQQEAQQTPRATITTPPTPTPIVVVVTATPQDTPTLAPPTPTPVPTNTPVPPTPTLLPTPTVPSNTPPGSILEVGESWQQNDIRLKLEEVSFSPDCLRLHFNLYNDTNHTIVTVINEENFSVVDNLGQRWRFSSFGFCYYGCTDYTEEIEDTIEAGEHFKTEGCDTWKVAFYGSVTDTRVDEVIVTVDGLSQISNAKWRIPIYH